MTLTETHKSLLRHALGLDLAPNPISAPVAVDKMGADAAEYAALAVAGLMREGVTLGAGMAEYHVTVAGLRAVWGRAAVYELTGDEVTARETEKKVQMYWQGAPRGRFKTGEVYRVGKATVRWLEDR